MLAAAVSLGAALEAPLSVLRAQPRDTRSPFVLDEQSRLAEVDARLSLGATQSLLARAGLSLGLDATTDWSLSIANWVALGYPGARDSWLDPVAARVTGFEASAGGVQARVRAAPRRATGPDLLALFAGAREAIGKMERVTLAVEPLNAHLPRAERFHWPRDPGLNCGEQRAFELVRRALSGQP